MAERHSVEEGFLDFWEGRKSRLLQWQCRMRRRAWQGSAIACQIDGLSGLVGDNRKAIVVGCPSMKLAGNCIVTVWVVEVRR